ncbi:PIG-L deacetylase family protein [Streptomyces sp. NBC_01190]|uniref:PIG-L deacetylase family protein n=1 Tax=Streptomyces sp. NBC_01190 TaxID=2903767 RepID=UPI00386EF451|nr:PIG-L family deacetylase [Streptomyces sp. NBC_01190]
MTPPAGRWPAFANPIQAPGTDESHWRSWRGLRELPELELPTAGRVVVVAAHPDDEVLGAGGTMALLADAGVSLTVVSVTDGERSHADSKAITGERLAELRAGELRSALDTLAAAAEVVRLKVPDTEVARHEQEVAGSLSELLSGAELLLAPWIGDVHGDHEAAGRAALAAARTASVRCLMYPVWMWHWAHPEDPRVPWASAQRVDLPDAALARKRSAVERFVSQVRPLGPAPEDAAILPPAEIAHHLRDVEVVFA